MHMTTGKYEALKLPKHTHDPSITLPTHTHTHNTGRQTASQPSAVPLMWITKSLGTAIKSHIFILPRREGGPPGLRPTSQASSIN